MMREADRKKNKMERKSIVCPRCHARIKPDVEKCPHCGQRLSEDEESTSDFINEGAPDWPGK